MTVLLIFLIYPFASWVTLHAFCHLWIVFNFSFFFKKIFQEYHQSVKQFGSRSGPTGPTFCPAWSGSKLFAKVISRQQKSPLAGKELMQTNWLSNKMKQTLDLIHLCNKINVIPSAIIKNHIRNPNSLSTVIKTNNSKITFTGFSPKEEQKLVGNSYSHY